ncbi:tRNA (guanosine(37)-N1)-methyltransferase TrmD [Lyticum sinuosum]|uniref:tRNA (guanine-N(1)-)-methyltransferase n=1 Tax=Lyticum sinuosum TaxID=1332059 RepID=A0AAE5AHV4_9RICK|nr:tRNA (guanosine(37)-N1)-methyltransferase TrmD [Lyticum sinuosum]MDZ5761224.1 tRNA (guanine-N(1)-)-methyltransferase [Lyticum sinuosum]
MNTSFLPWEVRILSMFPELFPGPLSYSIIGRALTNGIWTLSSKNIRDYTNDNTKRVDDMSYGGGGGMILKADVVANAIEKEFLCNNQNFPIIYLSPRGRLLTQKLADELSKFSGIQIICGRFEGIDQRIFEEFFIDEISIGDYVLSTGDIAAYVLIDACVRRLPGVISKRKGSESLLLEEESLCVNTKYESLLEYPHYTAPFKWRERTVPNILVSGNHDKIKKWRLSQAEKITQQRRPDLWKIYSKK